MCTSLILGLGIFHNGFTFHFYQISKNVIRTLPHHKVYHTIISSGRQEISKYNIEYNKLLLLLLIDVVV